MAHVSHAASALGATALGFVVVIVAAHLGAFTETARSTCGFLHVVGRLSAPPADDVRLVVTGAGTADTFRHGCEKGGGLSKF